MAWMTNKHNYFTRQRGAMFSMDARIALVIASILAGVIGTQAMQRIERSRVETAEQGVVQLMHGLETYYNTVSPTVLPPGNPSTFGSGAGNFASVILDTGIVPDASLVTDPWGNDWIYDTCTVADTIEGIGMNVQYAVLYSMGPDATADSGENDFLSQGSCAADFADWSPQGDDIGMKFNSLEIEQARAEKTKEQLTAVVQALQAYETQMYLRNQQICKDLDDPNVLPAEDNPAAGRSPGCDFDTDGLYDSGEEIKFNYYPRSTLDGNTSYYLVPGAGDDTGAGIPNSNFTVDAQGKDAYNPNSVNDMQTFLQLLGLSNDYLRDPWGRMLCYKSNASSPAATQAPFTASVTYTNTCN